MYLLLCFLGVMETRRQLVFWAENVFVLRKMNSYEKKLRRIARDRFIMEDWLWFVITALSNSVCEDSFSAFPSQWCAIKLDIDSAVLLTKKKEQKHNIMSPVLLQCACVSAGLWGAVSERDSVNTKCFLSKCWRICLCWSCSVCARTDVPG